MRVIGPPGTGKTTFLQRKVEELSQFYHKDEICLTSFTKAAAKVLSKRINGIDNIGTLHSLCYQNIGKPEIAETKHKLWNEKNPQYSVSEANKKTIDDMSMEDNTLTSSDILFSNIQINRSRMIPVDDWPTKERELFHKWYRFKYDNDLWDFTDMIEHNLMSVEDAPMNPRVFIVDEAQDLTSLEVELVKKWACKVDISLVAGDSDQCLYKFKGASPDDFVSIDSDTHILEQSYRVPSEVHNIAVDIISRVSNREDIKYLPRKEKGFVERTTHSYMTNKPLIEDIEKDIGNGYTVMLIASCSYMIDNVRDTLRRNNLPFHNPYRARRGDWNPIRKGGSVDDLRAFQMKDLKSFLLWQRHLKRSVFEKGIKQELKRCEKDPRAIDFVWRNYAKPELKENLGNVKWYVENCLAPKKKTMQYPLKVIEKYGNPDPRIVIGTIHSVKGGEADVVYLFPDLSASARKNLDDSVHRAFYVGATRAQVGLKICKPFTRNYYNI